MRSVLSPVDTHRPKKVEHANSLQTPKCRDMLHVEGEDLELILMASTGSTLHIYATAFFEKLVGTAPDTSP